MSADDEVAAAEANLAEAKQAVTDALKLRDENPPYEPAPVATRDEPDTFQSDHEGIALAADELKRRREIEDDEFVHDWPSWIQ